MPIGTEFEVNYDNKGRAISNMILKENDSDKYLDWINGPPLKVFDFLFSNIKFIPIQKPVSFMEVVNSNKRCKVEHEYVKEIRRLSDLCFVYKLEFKKGEYMPLNYLMYALGYHCSQEDIQEIIKNGIWYLEE